MGKGRVLFFYPNSEGYAGIPNGIALLSACLKEAEFETRCFDTTFLKSAPLDHKERQKHGGVEKLDVDFSSAWGKWSPELAEKAPDLFSNFVEEFKPDLIAASFAEVNYSYGIKLLSRVKKEFADIPIVVGGVFSILDPDLVIKNDCVDFVCVGEGEEALVELADCIVSGKDYRGIKNIWVKEKTGEIIKNPLRPLKDMETVPFQDWSIFDERHIRKPYAGKFYRAAFVELARGCPFDCTYCCTAALKKIYNGLGFFLRQRSVDKTLDEICYLKNKHGIELILFTDDNFLGMSKERLGYLCMEYKKRINLPFYIQTRAETIREDFVEIIKEMAIDPAICTFAVGIEHGSEEYRRKYMNRKMTNDDIRKAFRIIHEFGFRTTANIMIGMPYEDEKTAWESMKLLREIKPKSISVSYFQPFRGVLMREMAIKAGLISPDYIVSTFVEPLSNIAHFPAQRIKHYFENYQKYVNGDLEFKPAEAAD